MLKKGNLIILLFLFVIIILGNFLFSNRIRVDNPLSQKEIISYVQKQIYNDTGDDVIVKITNKQQQTYCSSSLCFDEYKVKGGHIYDLKITNKNNRNIISKGTYEDGYIYNGTKIEPKFSSSYEEQKGFHIVHKEFVNSLNKKFDNYHIYKNISTEEEFYDLYIFITSSNYDDINNLLQKFKDTIIKYRDMVYVHYSVYIYNDENIFNNTNFELYSEAKDFSGNKTSYGEHIIEHYTGKEVDRIGSTDNFSYDFFVNNIYSNHDNENIDYNSFDYLVFWYYAQPNSFVGYNDPTIQVFGVK